MPPFLLSYIGFIPGFPAFLTVPADDMQTERPNEHSHVRNHGKYDLLGAGYLQ